MPIRKNSVIIRDGLLEEISRVISDNPNQSVLNEQLKKIEQEVLSRRSVFPVGNLWDELVIQEIDALEQFVADKYNPEENPEEMDDKINRMNQNLQKLTKILDDSADFFRNNSESSTTAADAKQNQQKKQQQQQLTSNEWQTRNIEMNILKSGAMTVLQSSYHNLENHLKLCLLCFSVFPKNSFIKKTPLIYWWIGERFVTNSESKAAEMAGEEVLQQLQNKGLIKPWLKSGAPRVTGYTMHPWIHRMVISVARNEGFFDFDANGNVKSNSGPMSRRVCFVSGNTMERQGSHESSRQAEDGGSNSITFFNVNEQYLDIEPNWFSRQKRVRVLQLGRWQNSATHHIEVVDTKFLSNGLGVQKRLQYLSLRGLSRITELPESVAQLTALEILDLRACHNLERLPTGIKAMKKLTHLDVSECYLLEQVPKGLAALSHLQVLKGFAICNSRRSDACRLKDLAMLETLRKLSIMVGRDADIAQEELGHLVKLKKLQILTITWGVTKSSGTPETQSMSSSLSLPSNLEKLDLRCFPNKRPPPLLRPSSLLNLKRLYIIGGKLDSVSIGENESWKVEILRLKFLKDLEIEWSILEKIFPHLVYLEKKECDKLKFSQCNELGVWEKSTQI